MVDIVPTFPKPRPVGTLYVKWVLTASETGKPVNVSKYPDKTVTFTGTFGGAVTFEGTNEERGDPDHTDYANAKFVPITDSLDAAAMSKTADAGEVILQNYKWIRPKAAAGVTSVAINLVCSKRGV